MNGIFDGFFFFLISFAIAIANEGHAAICQYALHIVDVEINESMNGYDF